jgi:hypothetical protein
MRLVSLQQQSDVEKKRFGGGVEALLALHRNDETEKETAKNDSFSHVVSVVASKVTLALANVA